MDGLGSPAVVEEPRANRFERALEWSHHFLFAFFIACLILSLLCAAWIARKFGITDVGIAMAVGWTAMAALLVVAIHRRWYVPAGLIVISLRVGMFWVTRGAGTSAIDPHYYAVLAQALANGRDFTDHVDGVAFRAMAPRLYSYILAVGDVVFRGSPVTPYVVNFVIDSLTGLVAYSTARKLGSSRDWAIAAGALYLVWPHVVVASAFAHKEGLACLLTLACVWTLLGTWQDGRPQPIRFGFFLGLLGMAQPAFFLMTAAFPLVLFLRQRPLAVVRFLAIAAVATIVTLTPQIIRNWYATGGFVPLTTGVGFNMYANATGRIDFPDQYRDLSEAAWSKAMVHEAWKVIAAHPLAYAKREAKMLLLGFGLEHYTFFTLGGVKDLRILPTNFLPMLQMPLVAMWAAAVACVRYRRDDFMASIVILVLAYTAVVGIWFEFGARHRVYLLPMMLAWTAALLTSRSQSGTPSSASR